MITNWAYTLEWFMFTNWVVHTFMIDGYCAGVKDFPKSDWVKTILKRGVNLFYDCRWSKPECLQDKPWASEPNTSSTNSGHMVGVALSWLVRIWEECLTIHCLPALFFLLLFFFFKVVVSSRTLIPLSMQGSMHSGSVSWDDVAKWSKKSCVWAHFLIGSHTMPGQWHRQPTPTAKCTA